MDILSRLPNDIICKIMSLTSPVDTCKFSLTSPALVHVAKCDIVWESFLPSNYQEIVSRSSVSLNFSSKRELYFRLCDSILIDCYSKSFKLEKSSGKISYILSARELSITWSDNPMHWVWGSLPESRFTEVAILRSVSWLEIQANIKPCILSRNITYGVYLIIKINNITFGLDSIPSVLSLKKGNHIITDTAYLRCGSEKHKQQIQQLFYKNRMEMLSSRVDVKGEGRVPRERGDGWLEIELGEFCSGGESDIDNNDEVKVSLKEVKGYQLKSGLVVEGIEVRPK